MRPGWEWAVLSAAALMRSAKVEIPEGPEVKEGSPATFMLELSVTAEEKAGRIEGRASCWVMSAHSHHPVPRGERLPAVHSPGMRAHACF